MDIVTVVGLGMPVGMWHPQRMKPMGLETLYETPIKKTFLEKIEEVQEARIQLTIDSYKKTQSQLLNAAQQLILEAAQRGLNYCWIPMPDSSDMYELFKKDLLALGVQEVASNPRKGLLVSWKAQKIPE